MSTIEIWAHIGRVLATFGQMGWKLGRHSLRNAVSQFKNSGRK
jgi:hypothetical protein